MNDEMEIKQGIDLGKVFKKALEVYYDHFPQFISLSLIYAIGAAAIRILLKKIVGDSPHLFSLAVIFNTLILSRISVALIYMAAQKIFHESAIDAQEAFLKTKGFYATYS